MTCIHHPLNPQSDEKEDLAKFNCLSCNHKYYIWRTTYETGSPGLNCFEVPSKDILIERAMMLFVRALFFNVIPVKVSVTWLSTRNCVAQRSVISPTFSASRDRVISVQPLIWKYRIHILYWKYLINMYCKTSEWSLSFHCLKVLLFSMSSSHNPVIRIFHFFFIAIILAVLQT